MKICTETRIHLTHLISYDDLTMILTAATGIKEYSEWPTIPQLYLDKEFVGGCDILMSMHQDGSLAKVLDEKKVLVEGGAEGETKSQS